jgi:hypothetical protein
MPHALFPGPWPKKRAGQILRGGSISGMAIYDKSTRTLMRQMVTNLQITSGQVVTKETRLRASASLVRFFSAGFK